MATDPVLLSLVRDIETGASPGAYVWVAIPAGVICGEVVSQQRYLEELGNRAARISKSTDARLDYSFSKSGLSRYLRAGPIPRFIHLVSAILPFAKDGDSHRMATLGLARIALAAVSAWSFSQPPGVTEMGDE